MAISKIITSSLTDDAVTAAKIPAGAVAADIGTGGIVTANIADDAVTGDKIENSPTIAGTLSGNVTVGSGKTLDVSGGTLTTSTAQKQTISATAFASGTKMIFNQTAAPTGWTKDTSNNNDSALRVVTGSASTGGSVAFATAFASQTIAAHSLSVAGHTLTTSQMPSHNHSYTCPYITGKGYNGGLPRSCSTQGGTTGSTGGGGSHSHSISGSQTHAAIDLAVKYVDVIVATKD